MRMRAKKWARPELAVCPYFIGDVLSHKGGWRGLYKEERPLWIEMGCGKGGFLAQWGLRRPDRNFLGIDMISDMLGVARRTVQKAYDEAGREVDNLLLTCYDISRIEDIMDGRDQAERIFINFCNPWYKPKQYKKRLTHPRQLEKYRVFLQEGGEIWFKTDDEELFRHSLGYFKESGFEEQYRTADLHNSGFSPNIETEHERMYSAEGIPIKFVIEKRV